jgi:peptidoglycan biosynthesis protein MviN/MurJ (putative lipid II flippase)
VLIHQPIYLFTNYLIARGKQREIALSLLTSVALNVVLSVALVKTVGVWGVALATLVTDLAVLLYVVPTLVAPAAALPLAALGQAALRPLVPAAASAIVLDLVARALDPDTLLELVPIGCAWVVGCGLAIWWLGLNAVERAQLSRSLRGSDGGPVPEPV